MGIPDSYPKRYGIVSTSLLAFVVMLWLLTMFIFFIFHGARQSIERKLATGKAELNQLVEEHRQVNGKPTQGMVRR